MRSFYQFGYLASLVHLENLFTLTVLVLAIALLAGFR